MKLGIESLGRLRAKTISTDRQLEEVPSTSCGGPCASGGSGDPSDRSGDDGESDLLADGDSPHFFMIDR